MLEYLKEAILEVLFEVSDEVNLLSLSDRERIADEIVAKLSEEYLSSDATEEELEKELLTLRDENESLWLMLDELNKSDISNYSEELSGMINQKLAELALLIKAKPSSVYKN